MKKFSFNFFYDGNKKKNVDFLIQQGFDKPIPIEVSFGIKDKKQIKNAINRFNSDYAIIISNTTSSIEKDDFGFISWKEALAAF